MQLAAEQPSTEECWIPPKKDTPHQRAKEKPPKNGRRVKLHLESNPIPARDAQRAQTKPYVPGPRGPKPWHPVPSLHGK